MSTGLRPAQYRACMHLKTASRRVTVRAFAAGICDRPRLPPRPTNPNLEDRCTQLAVPEATYGKPQVPKWLKPEPFVDNRRRTRCWRTTPEAVAGRILSERV